METKRTVRNESRREFFDRDYSLREAYSRVWKYARKYRFRLIVGVVCGMLTAGTLVPFFQIVQPALQHVETHDARTDEKAETVPEAAPAAAGRVAADRPKNAFDKEIAKNSKLPSWYPQVEKLAAKCGTGGRLFGAITGKEISDALKEQFGIEIGKQKIVLDEPIKQCGAYELKAKLGSEISGKLRVLVTEE